MLCLRRSACGETVDAMPERESFRWKSKYLEDLSRGVKDPRGEGALGKRPWGKGGKGKPESYFKGYIPKMVNRIEETRTTD